MLDSISTYEIKSHALEFDALKGWCGNFYTCRTWVSCTRFSLTDLRNEEEEQSRKKEKKKREGKEEEEEEEETHGKTKPTHGKTKSIPLFPSLLAKPNPPAKKSFFFFSVFLRSDV